MTIIPPPATPITRDQLCARVIVKSWFCTGLGHFTEGQLVPIELWNAPTIEAELRRTDLPKVPLEVTIGIPNAPYDSTAEYSKTSRPTFAPRTNREGFARSHQRQIAKRAAELLAEHPSTYFAEKSPRDFAIDDLMSKANATIERERKRHQDAYDRLKAELPKRAERLRKEAEERATLALQADEEAEKIDALVANADASAELYALRVRLERFITVLNKCNPSPPKDSSM